MLKKQWKNSLHLQKMFLGNYSNGTAAFRKSRAMRSWVGLWRFKNLKSGGLLPFLTEAWPLLTSMFLVTMLSMLCKLWASVLFRCNCKANQLSSLFIVVNIKNRFQFQSLKKKNKSWTGIGGLAASRCHKRCSVGLLTDHTLDCSLCALVTTHNMSADLLHKKCSLREPLS